MPEIDVATILRAGGIAARGAKTPKGERAGPVSARVYAHPALVDRVVVRLSTEALAPGVDVEMETLGFAAPKVAPGVGLQRDRALGFPGWALVNDPAHAKFALEVMKDFKKAAARVKSKPGHARDTFAAIADRLARSVPHFLPSFWEEAGRAFLAEGGESFAAQAFEKARQTEKEHALSVDEEVRGTVFLEFALAGAVSVKSLAAYAKVLVASFGAAEGYERFYELTRRRTLGGMPPWSGMGKDLRALAKAAGKDLDAEDERLLEEILVGNAVQSAPPEFWATYEKALVRLARRSARVRARLRHLFPKVARTDTTFKARWLALLEASGALEAVIATTGEEAAREAHGMAADWLEKLLAYAPQVPAVLTVLDRMAPRLVAEGTPVQLAPGTYLWRPMELDVVERALERGIPIAALPAKAYFERTLRFSTDPVRTAADPRFARLFVEAVGNLAGQPEFERRAEGRAGLVAARRIWLQNVLTQARDGALVALRSQLTTLSERTNAAMFVEFPEAREILTSLDARAHLGRALRGGLLAEYAWPVFEEVVAELGATRVVGYFPYAVVLNSTRAIVVDARRRLLEHDLRMPPRAVLSLNAFFVPAEGEGGELYVSWWDGSQGGPCGYWSGKPDEPFSGAPFMMHEASALPSPGGGLSFGARPFRIGDTQVERRGAAISDGTTFYAAEQEGGQLRVTAIDAHTGQKLGAAIPALVAASLEAGTRLTSLHLQPAPANLERSPFGMAEGLVGSWAVTRDGESAWLSFGIDGRRDERNAFGSLAGAFRLMTFPGDARLRAVREDGYPRRAHLFDPEGRALGASIEKEGLAAGWNLVPPGQFWDMLVPRDEKGSAALRQVTDEIAGELLAIARAESAAGDAHPRTQAAILERLPEVTSEELRAGVLAVVLAAARSAESLASLVANRIGAPGAASTPAANQVAGPDDQAMRAALEGVLQRGWSRGHLASAVVAVSAALTGAPGELGARTSVAWEAWFGRVRGLAVAALAPNRTPEQRAAIAAFLARWKSTIFAREPAHVRVLDGTVASDSRFAPKAQDISKVDVLVRDGGRSYFVRVADPYTHGPPERVRQVVAVEYAPGGNFALPADMHVKTERRCTEPDVAWIDAFLMELSARGAPEWNPDAAADLATRTGLTRPEAILLWAGFPGVDVYGANFIEKELRERIGLTFSEAKVARETFKAFSADQRLSLVAAAAPSNPRDLWDPLAGGDASVVGRLARAWVERAGRRAVLREDVMLIVEKGLDTPLAPSAILNALLDPLHAPHLAAPAATTAGAMAGRPPTNTSHFTTSAVISTAMLVPFLFMELPVGDPYRAALATLVATVRARLSEPWMEVPVASRYGEVAENRALLELVGGHSVTVAGATDARDDGAIVAVLTGDGHRFTAVARPSKVPAVAHADVLWKLSATSPSPRASALAAWAALEELVPAFLARIEDTPVPAGAYEANPLASVPRLVTAVAARLKLTEAASALYLQLLTLADPTAKRVQTFNGWKPAEYKKAEAELVNAKRAVPGKRERAGREIFLLGAWTKTSGLDLPYEAWKKPLYEHPRADLRRMLPPLPLHALFEAAWKRIESGDEPRLEEV